MPKKAERTDLIKVVTIGVAVVSVALNALQYFASSRERQELRRPDVFFAFANDATLMKLYAHEISPSPNQPAFEIARRDPFDQQIRHYVDRATSAPFELRQKPVVSFVVAANYRDVALHNVRITMPAANGAGTVLLQTSLLNPKAYVLAPVDFREPGNDAIEPSTPPAVVVEDGAGESITVPRGDRITWMGGQFERALIRRVDAPNSEER